MAGRNVGFCVCDTAFSAILGVSLRVAVRIDGICARDTGFSAVLGVSLWVAVRIAVFCVRDTEFSAILGVSLQLAGKMLSGCQSGCLSVSLYVWQSDFESHDVVVHVEAVSYVEVALAEDAEAEVMVKTDRGIVAVHVQFDTGFAYS